MPALGDDDAACEVVRRVALSLPVDTALDVSVVDDGSARPIRLAGLQRWARPPALRSVQVIHLTCNLGHQRAIAVGLVHALKQPNYAYIVVMDSDGEDIPEDVAVLLSEAAGNNRSIVVAQRGARSEGITFRSGYAFYRGLFRAFTGTSLSFGNFSLFTADALPRITAMPELWNHYAATLRRSGLPITPIVVDRGQRLVGRSRMNFTSLVNHGLSAIAAFSDRVFARLLAAFMGITALLVVGLVVLVLLRALTELAIPGWTTTVGGLLGLAILQVGSVVALLTFMMLSRRSAPMIYPPTIADAYVHSISEVELES